MKANKSTLYTIIVLLVITLPLAVYGTILHVQSAPTEEEKENPNHEFHYKNKLYFYKQNGELQATYNCSSESCGYVKTSIDDDEYGINYYKDGQKEELVYDQGNYVLIEDGLKIMLFDKNLAKEIVVYDKIKDYHTDLANNLLIVKSEDKWGVLAIDTLQNIIPYNYDFIGLANKVTDDVLQTNRFIVFEKTRWYLFDENGESLTQGITEPIVDYNDKYLITAQKEIYDYSSNQITPNINYDAVYIVDNYVILMNNNLLLVFNDLNEPYIGRGTVGTYNNITFKVNENVLEVYTDGSQGTTIDLNI